MANFVPEPTKVPESIQQIELTLSRREEAEDELGGGGGSDYSATMRLRIIYDDGSDKRRSENVMGLLTTQQKQDLKALLDALYDKAVAEVLA